MGDFVFDVDLVSKASLISMRKFLPSEEYRLLKNRKSARLCRKKRKEERGSMQMTLAEAEHELNEVTVRLKETEKKLALSEKERLVLKKKLEQALTPLASNAIINGTE